MHIEILVFVVCLFASLVSLVAFAIFVAQFITFSPQALTPAEESELRKAHYAATGEWLVDL